jgi:hypothetical protein
MTMRWGFLALCGSLLLSSGHGALAAITVQQYEQSYETLRKVDDVPAAERASYMATHRTELAAATHIQEQAEMVYETLLVANNDSFTRYRRSLLCNFPGEEDQPITFKQLADEYIAELQTKNLPPEELNERLQYTDFAEMLVDKFMAHYECPEVFPTGPSAVSFMDVPPAPPSLPLPKPPAQ